MGSAAARWRFARMSPSQVNQDPVQGEFFTAASDLPDRLVRESIQNSLDARRRGQTVRVRFAFSGGEHALPVDAARRWLAGLQPHLQAMARPNPSSSAGASDGGAEADAMRRALDCLQQPMTWLTVGDSGTTGLQGNVKANRELEARNDFWGFFRSVGISPKGEDSGGSWGLGKWVFPDASHINAYLGVTQREGEDRPLLMGMALLKTHHLTDDGGDVKYPPYGYFAEISGEKDDEWLPLPVESGNAPDDLVDGAIADFQLERRLDGPGLSVVVPYPRESGDEGEDVLTPATIARAVAAQYFLPIVRGDLEVEIVKPGERTRRLDAASIERELPHIAAFRRDDNSPLALHRAVELARWAVGLDDAAHDELPAPARNDAELSALDLPTLRERFDRGERLAFRLTLDVRRRDRPKRLVPQSFRLYLERDDDLPRGQDYFVRGHLRIPYMEYIRNHRARALVLVDGESELGHLLRDAEGPAHASWNPQEQRLKDRWIGGDARVNKVRRAANLLLQRLVERPEEKQYDALADLFPADAAATRGRKGSNRTKTVVPPPSQPSPLVVRQAPDGFTVRASTHGRGHGAADASWDLRFVYDVARGGKGRAFRQFEQGARQGAPDFSLRGGQLRVDARGCEHDVIADNALLVRPQADDFHLTVSGLDDRDLLVEVSKLTGPPDGGPSAAAEDEPA